MDPRCNTGIDLRLWEELEDRIDLVDARRQLKAFAPDRSKTSRQTPQVITDNPAYRVKRSSGGRRHLFVATIFPPVPSGIMDAVAGA
jgi:hypothetical protein